MFRILGKFWKISAKNVSLCLVSKILVGLSRPDMDKCRSRAGSRCYKSESKVTISFVAEWQQVPAVCFKIQWKAFPEEQKVRTIETRWLKNVMFNKYSLYLHNWHSLSTLSKLFWQITRRLLKIAYECQLIWLVAYFDDPIKEIMSVTAVWIIGHDCKKFGKAIFVPNSICFFSPCVMNNLNRIH